MLCVSGTRQKHYSRTVIYIGIYIYVYLYLQTYNNELVRCLEELTGRRSLLQREIEAEEEQKRRLEEQARIIADKLAEVDR